MTKVKILYKGNFATTCIHESGAKIETEPPSDIGGGGKLFSPTDLLATSLASCMLTLMAMTAKKVGFDMSGASAEVEKEMVSDPQRRVGRVRVRIRCPHTPSSQVQKKLEEAALHCPVHRSLHPDVKQEIDFIWGI